MDKRKECFEAAKKVLTNFNEEELYDYVDDVFNDATRYSDLGSLSSISKAIQEINNEKLQSLIEDTMITMNNGLKFERFAKDIRDKKINLRETILKDRTEINQADNIQAAQAAARQKFYNLFYKKIKGEQEEYFMSPEGSLEVAKARSGMPASAIAKDIGKLLDELEQSIKDEMLSSNAMRLNQMDENHKILVIHEAKRLLNPDGKIIGKTDYKYARNKWIEYIKTKLDMHGTFKKNNMVDRFGHIETLNMEKIDKFLSHTFDNIANGRTEIFTTSSVRNDLEALERKKHTFFVWKDDLSWHEYNVKYGSGSYHSAVYYGINRAANKVGTARMYGDSPRSMFLNLEHVQHDTEPQTNAWNKHAEKLFNYANKINQSAVNPSAASWFANARALTGAAKNGKLLIAGLDDASSFAAYAQRFGGGWMQSFTDHLGNIFNNKFFDKAEKEHIAETMMHLLDSEAGYIARMVDSDGIGRITGKWVNGFYKWSGNGLKDKGSKIAGMTTFGKVAYKNSKAKWNDLNPEFRGFLEKHNMNDAEWELLRKKNPKGLKAWSLDNIESVTDAELKKLYSESDKNSSAYELRNGLLRKVNAMFESVAEASVGNPSEFLKATALNGTRPGELSGEVIRHVTQFKLFAIQNIDRILIKGFQNAKGNQAKAVYIANLMIYTGVLNWASNHLRYWSQGKSYPDIKKMSVPERIRFVAEHAYGQAGIGWSLLDPNHQDRHWLLNLFSSPSLDAYGLLGAGLTSGLLALTGDKKETAVFERNMKNIAIQSTPAGSLPLVEPLLREFLGTKSQLQPGQKQILGK